MRVIRIRATFTVVFLGIQEGYSARKAAQARRTSASPSGEPVGSALLVPVADRKAVVAARVRLFAAVVSGRVPMRAAPLPFNQGSPAVPLNWVVRHMVVELAFHCAVEEAMTAVRKQGV